MDSKQIQQITDRISRKLESHGVSPDRQSISDKLENFINGYGVVSNEAERKVLSDQYKVYDIPEETAGSSGQRGEISQISDIMPDDWVTLEAKVVSLQPSGSQAISQTGVLADSSGAVRFVVFSKAAELPVLELEQWYRIESAVVDQFRGIASLKIHSGSRITPLDSDTRCLMHAAPRKLRDLTAGVAPSIRVKYVEEWEVRSDRMMQTGLLADDSGRMKFVLWQDDAKEKLTLGAVYNIFYATVDEYNGRLSLVLNTAVWMEDEDSDISVPVKSLAPVPSEPLPVTEVRSLIPGYASLRVKFVEEWEVRSDRMMQTGLLGDESGRIKFVLWKDDAKEKLEPERVYRITNAKVDEYNGRLSLILNQADYVPEDPAEDIAVGTRLDELSGMFVQISGGSGLVKRCPVEGCGRVLSRQNFCPVHEIQTGYTYDLRIKGVVDDGHKARNVLIGREVTEALSGITMDQAVEISMDSPLGPEEIQTRLIELVCGKYVTCLGHDFDGRVLVKSAEYLHFDPAVTTDLINRAGVFGEGDAV
jgi:replication factor A1